MTSIPNIDELKFEEADDDFKYEEVEVISDDDDDISEDLDSALKNLQALTQKNERGHRSRLGTPEPAAGQVTRRPEVLDDFIRNFFVKMGLSRTNEVFESEWYELKATGRLDQPGNVPDVYLRNAELEEEVSSLRGELHEARAIAGKASSTWDKFRKERDFHRMHHKRVAQEKNKLITDIKRLKDHYAKYEPTILELKRKYEAAMKEKMLMSLERDKLAAKVDALEAQLKAERSLTGTPLNTATRGDPNATTTSSRSPGTRSPGNTDRATGASTAAAAAVASAHSKAAALSGKGPPASGVNWSPMPSAPRKNPYENLDFPPAQVKSFTLSKTFKGHQLSVANLALHPSKPILVTASDDKLWKMWHLPAGDLIMVGEGHKDWVAGADFHPRGTCLVSCSGDGSVKIWDFEKTKCVQTFSEHKQAVWGVKFHDLGDVVASCSLDHTVRLWDLPLARCRITLRGHVDSINDCCWQPFTNNLATASSDKTVSLWDCRSGLCVQTFYGHHNSCNACTFNLRGDTLASCDADGVLKQWDVRMVAEVSTVAVSKHPANKCAYDSSSLVLAVASDDGKVRCFNSSNGEALCELAGHEDAVQGVIFDKGGQYLMSCGSDNTFRMWA